MSSRRSLGPAREELPGQPPVLRGPSKGSGAGAGQRLPARGRGLLQHDGGAVGGAAGPLEVILGESRGGAAHLRDANALPRALEPLKIAGR